MANHKSAKKRILVSERRRELNKGSLSKLKTLTKKVFSSTDKTETEKSYKEAVSYTDKLTGKGMVHRNTAARKKAALTKHLNKLTASSK